MVSSFIWMNQILIHLFISHPPFIAGVAAAHGTATVLGAGAAVNNGLPSVPCAALPPHAPSAAGGDVLRRKSAVEGGVPFFCHCRVQSSEVVIADQHFLIGTVWTAAASHGTAGDHRLVVVSFLAAPPDFFVGSRGDLRRCESTVFTWVPLGGDVWIEGG